MALVIAAVVGVVVIAVIQVGKGSPDLTAEAAVQEQDQNRGLPGQWIDPGAVYPDTGDHVDGPVPLCEQTTTLETPDGKPACYHSNPPTSGPHAGNSARWGIYSEPVPREQLLHDMEHGGVIIWYNCTGCDEIVSDMRKVAEGYLKDGRNIIMTPYPDMEADTIAFTSWSRLDKFPMDQYSDERLTRFVEAHERRFNPENE